jgi:methionine sulfoxide reductase heme-binding subunit
MLPNDRLPPLLPRSQSPLPRRADAPLPPPLQPQSESPLPQAAQPSPLQRPGIPSSLPGGLPARLPGGLPGRPAGTVPARPAPKPGSRPATAYRGLPTPVKYLAWFALLVVVGAVLGATAPTTLRRLGAVIALNPEILGWYSVRAIGFLAYLVLAASVLYGLLLSTKILDAIAHRPVSFALHKDLSIVALVLVGLHMSLLIFDTSFPFTPRAILVPFASPYSPIWVGVGQLVFYSMVVVTASFYVRRFIGQRAWRILHYVTFLSFIGATGHGIMSGSDSGSTWAFWIYLVPTASALFLLTYRIVVSVASGIARIGAPAPAPTPGLRVLGPLDRPSGQPLHRPGHNLADPSAD